MPEGPTPAPSAPPSAVAEDRLDSWKEIAAYLNHDVTTVQRWEKREGPGIVREATKLIPDFATNESSALRERSAMSWPEKVKALC